VPRAIGGATAIGVRDTAAPGAADNAEALPVAPPVLLAEKLPNPDTTADVIPPLAAPVLETELLPVANPSANAVIETRPSNAAHTVRFMFALLITMKIERRLEKVRSRGSVLSSRIEAARPAPALP
jgi:hypothetical protein